MTEVVEEDFKVNLQDLRATGTCVRGARAWIESQGFSWKEFKYEGLSAKALIATDDAIAKRVVEAARGRWK